MSTCHRIPPDPTGGAIQLAGIGISLLCQGLHELNFQYEKNQQMNDCEGKLVHIDILVQNLQGERIGIVANKDGGVDFILKDLKSATALEAIKQIQQRYTKFKVLHELERRGYKQIKQEKLPDGSFRIVVEKWE